MNSKERVKKKLKKMFWAPTLSEFFQDATPSTRRELTNSELITYAKKYSTKRKLIASFFIIYLPYLIKKCRQMQFFLV